MEAVQRALDAGFAVSIATMVHGGNLSEFDEMDGVFRELGIKDWSVDVPSNTGRMKQHPEIHVDAAEAGRYLGYGYGEGIHASTGGFACGQHLMTVMADGTASKCGLYREKTAGNISDGIKACWTRIAPVRLAELSCKCEFLNACRGGCRYRAELLNGKGGRDPYRCSLYGMLIP
jgi:radical SAM protein with 4Fe4S-binding SPASM domain